MGHKVSADISEVLTSLSLLTVSEWMQRWSGVEWKYRPLLSRAGLGAPYHQHWTCFHDYSDDDRANSGHFLPPNVVIYNCAGDEIVRRKAERRWVVRGGR